MTNLAAQGGRGYPPPQTKSMTVPEHTQRVAVITGAAQGIGRRTAEVLAERGYRLALIDLSSCAETRATAEKSGAEIDVIEFNGSVTDEAFINATAKSVLEKLGAPDV